MDQPDGRILVMARAPVAGAAKTRLEPLLGSAGCARLQSALVRHTVATAAATAPVSVAVAGPPELVAPLVPAGVDLFTQPAGDLGSRIAAGVEEVRARYPRPAHAAARSGRRAGDGRPMAGAVVVLGTDCPQLGTAHLAAALGRLSAGADVVFGPAGDGGYYLVGLGPATPAAPVFDLPPAAWGGPEVLALSRAAASRAGLRVALLDVEHDLDTPADAARTRADPRVPATIAALLQPGPG